MKILLIGHGRCGSSSLHYALADVLNLEKIIEPFNIDLWQNNYKKEPPYKFDDKVKDNTIFKCITWHTHNNILVELSKQFDRVILIARKNIRETMESAYYAEQYGYNNPYRSTDDFIPKVIADGVLENYYKIFELSYGLGEEVLWYEDLCNDYDISFKSIQKLYLGITEEQFNKMWKNYLNPKFRLRKVSKH